MNPSSFTIPRNWWGKIVGAILGLFKGGISGALIGGILGHFVDRFFASIAGVGNTQQAFFRALFSTIGHLSKADGRVTQNEIRAAETLMQRMQINAEERRRAIEYFNEGKQIGFSLEDAITPFVQHSRVRPDLRQMFMEIVVDAAFADGKLSEPERNVLVRLATHLRIPGHLFTAMLQARQFGYEPPGAGQGYQRGSGNRGTAARIAPLSQAYAKLGLQEGASDAEVKKAYRKLVSQYHPDKLVSRGLPEEMMEVAKTRVREINTAYDQIKQAKGFK
ncbi:MAG TPA: co-chaperone DjlA [Xanthomonadales bacterium]|nr:co-chaperone DjlA [Xanthomonadales bacterium]